MPVCGFGGQPRCTVRVERRGLCDEHRAFIREAAERSGAKKPGGPPKVEAAVIDPSDVFDAGGRPRVPVDERAEWTARWVHRQVRPVLVRDAVMVLGLRSDSQAGRRAVEVAVEWGWLRRVRRGVVAPGPTPL